MVFEQEFAKIPQNMGDYDELVAQGVNSFGIKERVFRYGCEWESKVENNTYAPATLNESTGVITPDTTHWRHVSGSYEMWLVDHDYGKLSAANVKDVNQGNKSQQTINTEVGQKIAELETAVGTGGTVDQKIAVETNRAKNAESAIDGRVTTLENAVGSGGSVDSRIADAKTEIIGNATSACDTLGEAEGLISAEKSRAQAAESDLQQLYEALTQSDIEVVNAVPASGVANKIYRVVGQNSYADYMFNSNALTTPIKMATYDNAIDDVPTAGSNNLVKSGCLMKSSSPNILITSTDNTAQLTISVSGGYLNLDYAETSAYVYYNGGYYHIGQHYSFPIQGGGRMYSVVYNIETHNLECYENQNQETQKPLFMTVIINGDATDIYEVVYCVSKFYYKGKLYKSWWGLAGGYISLQESLNGLTERVVANGLVNNFCFTRMDSEVEFSVNGTTAKLKTNELGMTIVYKAYQRIIVPAHTEKTFTIERGGLLYLLVYSERDREVKLYKYEDVPNNEAFVIIGVFITSPPSYSDAIYDYYGFYNITVNGKMSYGGRHLDNAIFNSIRIESKLCLGYKFPIVKGNRLEIFRSSITTEPHNMFDLQVLATEVDPYNQGTGRFRQNGYIFDARETSAEFNITFRLVDYMANNVISSVSSQIIPVTKKSSPGSNKNILVIGDSYTSINTWVEELERRLIGNGGTPVADGLSNITFIGTQNTQDGVPCEGWSGKDYAFFVGTQSPFYKNGSINIAQYVSDNGFSGIDYALILLGCNGEDSISSITALYDALLSYNSSMKIIVGSNKMKYNQDGWSDSLGLRAGMRSSVWRNWYDWNNSLMELIRDSYSQNILYIDIPAQIDIDNNFMYELGNANNRNSEVKVRYGIDNVHPADSAYYQIADAFYSAFHYWCL